MAKSYEEYLEIFKEQVAVLISIAPRPEDVDQLKSEEKQKEFIIVFRDLTKTLIRLENFEEFEFTEEEVGLEDQTYQDYKSKYFLIKENHDRNKTDKVSILDDIDFALEIMHRDKINVDYIMNLIKKIDLENEDRKREDIAYIVGELERADNKELRSKVELIKEFLDKVVPKLSKDDSIEDEFINFEKDRKARKIDEFAIGNRLPKDQVEGLVQEYEFSGIIDKEGVSDTLTEAQYSFLENVKKLEEVEIFIREIAEEYR